MGGTGVGKSSLLNKLARQDIAKAGIERPTSREVTLYHHQQVSLHQLEAVFPLQDLQVSQHSEALNKSVVWVDMPDFDSTEEKNKDIVMQWLPYVDVLLYVVSPERYRDNKAWQLLLREGANHAWLFVMNQWDRGDAVQFDDFKQQLAKAGFEAPIIYKTICHADAVEGEDELPLLQQTIASLATENTIKQLENRGDQQRQSTIKMQLQQCLTGLGSQKNFSAVTSYQYKYWGKTKIQLMEGFEWPIKQLAIVYAKKGGVARQDTIKLWDEWAQSRFNDYLDGLILNIDQQDLSAIPVRNVLVECRENAEKHLQIQTELSCRKALTNPGNIVQRTVLTTAKICEVILPLLAMGLVGFQVFQGYYDSAMTNQDFLGVDFAVHSLLLILISWLIPFFITKKMRPSLEKAAFKGLNNGVNSALSMIERDVELAVTVFKDQHLAVTQSLGVLIAGCDSIAENEELTWKNTKLERMLLDSRL
jgi:hypothetical protein